MKILFVALALFCSSSLAGEMVLTENYSITVNLADSTAPDNSFLPQPIPSYVNVDPNRWTTTNTVLEVAFQVLNIIDWRQTRYIAEHPDQFMESESAWALSSHPTTGRVDAYMFQTAVLHPIISYYLPHRWREAFQYVSIGLKINNTVSNASIGIKAEF